MLSLSPRMLVTIVATCLTVGSGGAYALRGIVGGTAADNQAPGLAATAIANDARVAVLEERGRQIELRLDRIETALGHISDKLDNIPHTHH